MKASWLALVLVAACAAGGVERGAPLAPDVPDNRAAVWQRELGALCEALFANLQQARLDGVLVSRGDLDRLLTPNGRLGVERERGSEGAMLSSASTAWAWSNASYVGFCVQDVHLEPAGDRFGLRMDAWVAERVLLVAQKGRARSATWVEGRFFHTNRGWKALSIARIEPPRSHHTDLEVARCDVEAGIR